MFACPMFLELKPPRAHSHVLYLLSLWLSCHTHEFNRCHRSTKVSSSIDIALTLIAVVVTRLSDNLSDLARVAPQEVSRCGQWSCLFASSANTCCEFDVKIKQFQVSYLLYLSLTVQSKTPEIASFMTTYRKTVGIYVCN